MPAGQGSKHRSKDECLPPRHDAVPVRKTHAVLTEDMVMDAENLFAAHDSDGTQLLSRGALTELLKLIGLEPVFGEAFRWTAQLAFDAHSADSHFLSLMEFKRLYYLTYTNHPQLLPRRQMLTIYIVKAKGLPPADANGRSDPFATVQVAGKAETRSQTPIIKSTLDPEWRKDPQFKPFSDKYGYTPITFDRNGTKVSTDTLQFSVYDYDKPTGSKLDVQGAFGELLGRCELPAEKFESSEGFQGWLPLGDLPKDAPKGCQPSIYVQVVYNGPFDTGYPPSVPASAAENEDAPRNECTIRFMPRSLQD